MKPGKVVHLGPAREAKLPSLNEGRVIGTSLFDNGILLRCPLSVTDDIEFPRSLTTPGEEKMDLVTIFKCLGSTLG